MLSWLIGMGAWERPVAISIGDAAADLEISKENARVLLTKLRQKGAIENCGREPGRYQHRYKVNMRVHQIELNGNRPDVFDGTLIGIS